MEYSYKPRGVCSSAIKFDVVDGILKNVEFVNGCDGNSKGLASLANDMNAKEVAKKLEGITCESRSTSCPGQLAEAIKQTYLEKTK